MGVSRKYSILFNIPRRSAHAIYGFLLCTYGSDVGSICYSSSPGAGNIWRGLQAVGRAVRRCQGLGKRSGFAVGEICAIQTLKIAHFSASLSLAESSVYLFISIVGAAVLGCSLLTRHPVLGGDASRGRCWGDDVMSPSLHAAERRLLKGEDFPLQHPTQS